MRAAVVAAAVVVLGVAGAARPAAKAPMPLIQVTPKELRLSQPFPPAPLAAEGNRAAVAFCNQLVVVWRPGMSTVTRLGAASQFACPPPRGIERIYSIAFAGDRVAWAAESGGNSVTGLIFLDVLRTPRTIATVVLTSMCCRPTADERVGWVYGHGGFLVFASRVKCNDPGAPHCRTGTQPALVSQTVWRLRRPPFHATCVGQQAPCQQLTIARAGLEPLSVDSGRVVLRHANGVLVVLDGAGRIVRSFPGLGGASLGAELMGNRLVVLVPGKVRVFPATGGRQLQARPLPNVSAGGVCGVLRCAPVALRLVDAKRGLVAYVLSGKLHLLRLRDGRNRVVAPAVDARFGDTGLFYAYRSSGPWPSRVRFVPWSALPVPP